MKRTHEEGALHGYDGRIVYADPMTAALYGALTPAARMRVRSMIENEWQGSEDLESSDIKGGMEIASAQMHISDCVARSEIVFCPQLPEERRIVASAREMRIPGGLPDTLQAAAGRSDLATLTGNALLARHRVWSISREDDTTILHHHSDPCHLIEPEERAIQESIA